LTTPTKPKSPALLAAEQAAAAHIKRAERDSLVVSEIPNTNVIMGGRIHDIPNSEIQRFLIGLTKTNKTHKDSSWLVLANDALNNISPVGHYYKKANAYLDAKTQEFVNVFPWHLDQLNHERVAMMIGFIDTLAHVECAIAARQRDEDDVVGIAYGAGSAGRHNAEFVGIARQYFDEFLEAGDIDPATGITVTVKRQNTPIKLNAKTQRYVDSFTFDESKFTVSLVVPEVDPEAAVPQKSLRLTCEVHDKFVISVPVATQNAKNEDKSPVRYKWSCDVLTSKADAKAARTCNKVLIAKV